jgi:excisionase family DNA binding protein
MQEMLLTVEQAAERLQLKPETIRRQLLRGALRGVKRGRVWRVPESALLEPAPKNPKPATAGGQ